MITGRAWRQDDGPGWFDGDPDTAERVGADGCILIAQLTVWRDEFGAGDVTLVGTVTWRLTGGTVISEPYEISTTGVLLPGACCYDDGTCVGDLDPMACMGTGGAFQGPLSACADSFCAGACCLPSNACEPWVGLRGCAQVGGDFKGYGSTCSAGICPCVGDVDGDGDVGFNDLVQVLGWWGACEDCPADLDEDGIVGMNDVITVLAHWGECT